MSELNLGQIIGRSARLNNSDLISGLQQEDIMMRQAKLERNHDIEKLAAGIEMPGDFNQWDDPIVKGFVQDQVKAMGELINNNPNIMNDPKTLMQLNYMKKELLSNPAVAKAKRIQTEYSTWQDFIKSDKEGLYINTPEYQQVIQEWDNYTKFGDINGPEGGGGEFRFKNPGKSVDLNQTYQRLGNGTRLNAMRNRDSFTEFYASDNDIKLVAEALMGDRGVEGINHQKAFQKAVEEGTASPDDFIGWTMERIRPFTNNQRMNNPNLSGRTTGGGGDKSKENVSPYAEAFLGFNKFNTSQKETQLIGSGNLVEKNGKKYTNLNQNQLYYITDEKGNLVPLETSRGMQFEVRNSNAGVSKMMMNEAATAMYLSMNPNKTIKDVEQLTQDEIKAFRLSATALRGTNEIKNIYEDAYPVTISLPLSNIQEGYSLDFLNELESNGVIKDTQGGWTTLWLGGLIDGKFQDEGELEINNKNQNLGAKLGTNTFGKQTTASNSLDFVVYMPTQFNLNTQTEIDKIFNYTPSKVAYGENIGGEIQQMIKPEHRNYVTKPLAELEGKKGYVILVDGQEFFIPYE
jgi:hypothetical protein